MLLGRGEVYVSKEGRVSGFLMGSVIEAITTYIKTLEGGGKGSGKGAGAR